MNIPENLKYTKEHEWIKIDGNIGTVGITDYAQGELGDIIYVDIPSKDNISQGETFGTIEAVKTVSDLYAPLSGKIVEINNSINDNPSVVNQDPYGEGWIIKIEISDKAEVEKLLNASNYKELVGSD
ncbi:MAG: glycine cleavage system protein GcvH [Ignavibacteria bacterium]